MSWLVVLIDGVWPLVVAGGVLLGVLRDRRHREDSVQAADDYAHETWGYLCEIRDLADQIDQIAGQFATEEPDPGHATEVIQQVMSRTPGQVDRSHGGAGRHRYRRDNPR